MLRRITDPLGKCLTQDDEIALGPNSLYDLTGGIQVPAYDHITTVCNHLVIVVVVVVVAVVSMLDTGRF